MKIRLVHFVPTDLDYQSIRALEMLGAKLGDEFEVFRITVGPKGTFRSWASAAWHLRNEYPADVLHGWGAEAMTTAVLSGADHILFSPIGFPTRRSTAWLRAITTYRSVETLCPTATMRRVLIERGIHPDRCHLLRPGVDFSKIRSRRDPALRASLGFSDRDFVLLGTGESTRQSAHEMAVRSAIVLHKLDEKYKLLLWGRGRQVLHVRKMAENLNDPQVLHLAEERLKRSVEFEQLLPAADAVIVTADGPAPTLPVVIAMAAGLPIVASVSYTISELLEDRHTALMTGRSTPRELARRVLDLQADVRMQWSISDMAKTEAYAYFAMSRFIDQHRQAYRQIAEGKSIHLPEPATSAGLRFHGQI